MRDEAVLRSEVSLREDSIASHNAIIHRFGQRNNRLAFCRGMLMGGSEALTVFLEGKLMR